MRKLHVRQSIGRVARLAGMAVAIPAAVLSMSATTVAHAAPASAAQPGPDATVTPAALGDCPDNNMCAWEHNNYGGRYIYMVIGCSNFRTCFNSDFNDRTSSLWNRTPYKWCFYTNANYGGRAYAVPSGATRASLGSWNDSFSSAHRADFFHRC